MNELDSIFPKTEELNLDTKKAFNPFSDFSCCVFKKCCKKYKKGKRCRKCPDALSR